MNISRIGSSVSSRVEAFKPPSVQQSPHTKQAPATTPKAAPGGEVLNKAEKDYFAGAFPAASAKVQSHQVYSPAGKSAPPSSPGGLIDRKG